MRKIFFLVALFFLGFANAQELNCTVTVNSEAVGQSNNQIFKTLQTALNDFVNRTDWTGQSYDQNERIPCSMFINVTQYNSGQFQASIQVQSARQVYNSSYASPIFNFNDKDFNFDYIEFQNLNYSAGSYDSNLVSVISFYSLLIIGLDADTFALNGGSSYLESAQDIVSVSQQGGSKGWSQSDGSQNRYFLINDLLSPTYSAFREALFDYHFKGLDKMAEDTKAGKEGIKAGLDKLNELNSVRPNAFLTRIFFDAKSDEIVSIFSGGPSIPITDLVDKLTRLSPLNAGKWSSIKF
jgi:Domain of unknown function (DUF4835)